MICTFYQTFGSWPFFSLSTSLWPGALESSLEGCRKTCPISFSSWCLAFEVIRKRIRIERDNCTIWCTLCFCTNKEKMVDHFCIPNNTTTINNNNRSLWTVQHFKRKNVSSSQHKSSNTKLCCVLYALLALPNAFATLLTSRTTFGQQIKPRHVLGWLGYKLVN